MGWLSDAYSWVDANIAGGMLPGGVDVTKPGATIAGVIPTPFYGIQPAAAPVAPVAAGSGMFASGGAATQAAQGMTVVAPSGGACAPRGKLVTAVAKVLENGQVIPLRMMPGTPVAMSSDLAAVRRSKAALKRLSKLFPSKGRSSNRASKKNCR